MNMDPMAPDGKMSRRELLMRAQPLGNLKLDASLCSGCGLCVLRCATGAIQGIVDADDSYRLIFRHGSCVGCGDCAAVCPEKCISLQRTLDPEKLSSPTVLFQGRLARCSSCGRVIGTREMLERIKNKMHAASLSELCPDCKAASFRAGKGRGI